MDANGYVFVFYLTDVNECETDNGGCAHMCSNTVGSFTCSCNAGYALNADGSSCDGRSHIHTQQPYTEKSLCLTSPDIDECDTNNGGCEQVCTNSVGSFMCSCNSGYIINSDDSSMCDGESHTNLHYHAFKCVAVFYFILQILMSVQQTMVAVSMCAVIPMAATSAHATLAMNWQQITTTVSVSETIL